MHKKFLPNLLLMVFLNFLVKPFYIFGIDATVQGAVGEEAYGNYFALLNATFIFNIFLDFGITNFNVREVAQNEVSFKKYFSKLFALKWLFLIPYFGITFIFGWIVGFSMDQMYLLGILCLNQFFVSMILFFRSNLAGMLKFKRDALFSILDRIFLIIICGTLLWGFALKESFEIEWFIYAQTISYGLVSLILGVLLFRNIQGNKIGIDRKYSIVMFRKSLPFAILILLMYGYTRMDVIMIERLLGDGKYQAGVYVQGFRLLDTLNVFPTMFAGILLPLFTRMLRERNQVDSILNQAFGVMLVLTTSIAGVTWIAGKEILEMIYSSVGENSVTCFKYLMLSFVAMAGSHIFGTLITANGKMKVLNWIALIGMILNITLNYWFIQHEGIVGAAKSTLFTQVLIGTVQVIYCLNSMNIKWGMLKIGRLFLYFIVFIGSIFLVKDWLLQIPFVALMCLLGTFALLISILLKIIDLKDLRKSFESFKLS